MFSPCKTSEYNKRQLSPPDTDTVTAETGYKKPDHQLANYPEGKDLKPWSYEEFLRCKRNQQMIQWNHQSHDLNEKFHRYITEEKKSEAEEAREYILSKVQLRTSVAD